MIGKSVYSQPLRAKITYIFSFFSFFFASSKKAWLNGRYVAFYPHYFSVPLQKNNLMENKKIPIGQSDFKTVVTERYYIDKTLYIKEVIDADTSLLATRPRRFGKTLNMTMLKYFYDIREDHRALFKGLKIETEEGGKYMEKCGKYPVIYLTFKDLKSLEWKEMCESFSTTVCNAVQDFQHIFDSWSKEGKTPFKSIEVEILTRFFTNSPKLSDFQHVLRYLCKILSQHYGQKAVILIDEYDTPVIASYSNGYYKEMINLMKDFLGGGLKDNIYLEKGVLTGITRVAKESMFSGLNNFDVFSILDAKMSDKFGFTQAEVDTFLSDYGLFHTREEVKLWYDSYQFGEIDIYNPWSVLNFVDKGGKNFSTFWANSSDNALIQEVMFNKEASIRNHLEDLIQGKWLKIRLEENLAFGELYRNVDAVWNLLLFGGYLTYRNIESEYGVSYCEVKIPNIEISSIFRRFIMQWVEAPIQHAGHEDMLQALLTGQIGIFKKIFQRFVEAVFSYHDTAGDMPEKFYHAFFLGLMVKLEAQYHIFSNKEIGYGRADICLVPRKDKQKIGIIIELKSPDKADKETLTMGLQIAEKQIITRNYAAVMKEYEIPNFVALAISVQGKKSMVKEVNLPIK